MNTRSTTLERPAPAEQRIGAEEAMHKADSSIVTSATCWQRAHRNRYCFHCVPLESCRYNSHTLVAE
jgi:hypothetical protein